MTKSRLFLALALLGPCACRADAPAPMEVAAAAHAPAASHIQLEPAPAQTHTVHVVRATNDAEPPASVDPASVLDDEERRLLAADDATLTKEQRVARAHAQRKLVLADPTHPLRPAITAMERDVASGEYATMARDMWTSRAALPDADTALVR